MVMEGIDEGRKRVEGTPPARKPIQGFRDLEYVSEDEHAHFVGEYQILARQLRTLIDRWRPLSSVLPPSSSLRGNP